MLYPTKMLFLVGTAVQRGNGLAYNLEPGITVKGISRVTSSDIKSEDVEMHSRYF